ncbi:hypothetical protein VUR80DRAFT_9362 [Thermomyces stellatus]
MARPSYRIGVDVGGTNTDAVILDPHAASTPNRGIVASQKHPTTSPNVTSGIEAAVRSVLTQSGVPPEAVACLTIGTTHFINAIVEHDARRLSRVGVIRLSKAFTRDCPPFCDFPPELARIMHGYHCFVDGGLHIDGAQEAPVREEQVVGACKELKARGIDAIVVSGVFSPIDEHFRQEDQVRRIILREMPGSDVVCSSEVAQIGFLERENASILNASILKFARRTIAGFRSAMRRLNLRCPLYLTQNDGTLIDAAGAARLPIRTFSSGPTNSMRGAAYLGLGGDQAADESGEKTPTVVVDIGGTTADVGVLLPSGFPRQASAYVTVAGVKINFGMPHIESIGLGGGSIIRVDESASSSKKVTVGPDSVGHFLDTKATVFGGDTLTATDIAVASDPATNGNIGDPSLVANLDATVVAKAQAKMRAMLESVIDKMKTSPAPLPVLLVGGGSVIAPGMLDGVSQVICPPHHAVANAVGAAISKVGGAVDAIQSTAEKSTSQLIEEAKATAVERAVAAGALRETVYVAEIDSLPLQYVANQVRVVVRAVGDLSPGGPPSIEGGASGLADGDAVDEEDDSNVHPGKEKGHVSGDSQDAAGDAAAVNPDSYRPKVVRNPETGNNEWIVSETDLAWIADGCYVLGCAGGGSPISHYLRLRDQLRAGHVFRVIDAASLKDDDRIYWGGHLGSPAVSVERLANDETEQAVAKLMEYLGHEKADAFIDLEIGGGNGLQGLELGSSKALNCPTVDADFMGRAYPTAWQTTICAYESGTALVPCAITSGDGITIMMTDTTSDEIVDRALRAACAQMGSSVGWAAKPVTKHAITNYSVLNTVSLAWRIGRTIARAAATNTMSSVAEQMVDECGGPEAAKVLFRGKIVAVERRLHMGHSYGEITVQQAQTDDEEKTAAGGKSYPAVAEGGVLKIPFKNENIYAKHVSEDGSERFVATVPDLISVIDTQSGRALGVPEFRYGVMVTVLGITCSPRWTDTTKAMEIGGPGAFGYRDLKYKPLGKYVEPKSVVREYAPTE